MDHVFHRFPYILSASLNWRAIFTRGNGKGAFKTNGRALNLEDRGQLLRTNLWTPDLGSKVFIDTLRIHREREKGFVVQEGDNTVTVNECLLPPGCEWGWNEKPLESLKATLLRNKEYIKEADIVIGMVASDSDEGDRSRPEKRVTANQVVSVFNSKYPGKPFLGYGILMTPEDPGCREKWKWAKERITYGERIAKLAELTDGANFSLCESDYDALAQEIISDIRLKARFLQ